MDRCERLMVTLGESRTGKAEFWDRIQRLTARFLESNKSGAVVRISCLLDQLAAAMGEIPFRPSHARVQA